MAYLIRPMDDAAARAVITWRYAPPYDVYSFNGQEAVRRFLCAPANDYHAVYAGEEAQRQLAGFCCFGLDARVPGGNYAAPALDVGVGMRPDLTGSGHGHEFVGAVIAYGAARHRPLVLRATIAEFNERSQRVFSGHGFQPVQRFERITRPPRDFVVMLRAAD
ncbi:MAG: GNAT family N-acetyltransferase [Caldilineaceae bacterium]|nr:GNAT family N-acetyltransferase [Caldilineaceae bacterium]